MIVEAPQEVVDRIVDRFIDESPGLDGARWVMELDACRLAWRRQDGICPCGNES